MQISLNISVEQIQHSKCTGQLRPMLDHTKNLQHFFEKLLIQTTSKQVKLKHFFLLQKVTLEVSLSAEYSPISQSSCLIRIFNVYAILVRRFDKNSIAGIFFLHDFLYTFQVYKVWNIRCNRTNWARIFHIEIS